MQVLVKLIVCVSMLCLGVAARAENITLQDIQKAFAHDTTVSLAKLGIRIESYGYDHDDISIEAILFKPTGDGAFPAVMMIPGYSRSAVNQIPMGVALARRGYVCLAVTQPGFGRSSGDPDFVVPKTVGALLDGYSQLVAEPFVDGARTVLFGYSRGAMAASLLACRLPDLRGAVLGGGIYDLEAAYREIESPGVRRNIEKEAGTDTTAFRERSALFQAERIRCPVLILHGGNDKNAPVGQAYRFHERLLELGKSSRLEVVEGVGHGLSPRVVLGHTLDALELWMNSERGNGR